MNAERHPTDGTRWLTVVSDVLASGDGLLANARGVLALAGDVSAVALGDLMEGGKG